MLHTKIEKHVNLTSATEEDLLDLLTISSNALVQCHANGYDSMDFLTVIEWIACIQDSFTTIRESKEFLETTLTRQEWVQLTQWVSQELQFRYRD